MVEKHLRVALTLVLALLFIQGASAQQSTQSFTVIPVPAPPTVNNALSSSTTTGTGVTVSTTGGAVAAGAWRLCVTWVTATGTESNCSVDTAASSVVTTTGTTSTITVQPPVSNGVPGNVRGWRVWAGANAGAAGAESAQTATAAICDLSGTPTIASCSLSSPAVFTASTGFSGGTAPATWLAFSPPIAQAATTAVFENSVMKYHKLDWVVTGTAPATCTVQLQQGTLPSTLANVGQSLTCTASGGYALPSVTGAAYAAVNLSAYSLTDGTTSIAFYFDSRPFNPSGGLYYANAAPSGTCLTGAAVINTAGGVSTTLYTCNAGTWTAVTVP